MSTKNVCRRTFASIFCVTLVLGFLTAVPAQAQTPTTVYAFTGTPGPVNPNIEAIAQGRDGNLYLTTPGGDGGALNCTVTYCGEAFKITTSGTITDLFDFSNNNCSVDYCGNSDYGGLTLGTDGNFYGVTYYGGTTGNNGTVFKLTPAGVLTPLYNFTGGSDGSHPYGPLVQAASGIFYGTTTSVTVADSTVFSITSTGTFKTLHTFTGTDGQNVYAPLVQGTDGNFYGNTLAGGTSGDGVIFKMSSSGTVTVLHNFTGTDGSGAYYPLIQASDGNLYGTAYAGGTAGFGVVFKITPTGTYTVLRNINGTTDGVNPAYGLVQATDGKMYGVTTDDNSGSAMEGTIFSVTTSGTFTTLYAFIGGPDGGYPLSPMRQHTSGLLYGTTYYGGDASCSFGAGCGLIYSLNIGAKPFVSLVTPSGKVGSKIGILGQGFTAASVVKFNGVQSTRLTRSGSTFLSAAVPAGATDGFVTVTTGTTTLTSNEKFIVHNSWSQGKAMPTAIWGSGGVGVLDGSIYVVGGASGVISSTIVADTQIYNPATNSWHTGAPLPTPLIGGSGAVVNGILYIMGGSTDGTTYTNAVWAYNPSTKTWTAKAAMPTALHDAGAAVEKGIIYVVGGNSSSAVRAATVESYNPATNTWTTEASLLTGKSEPSVGLAGTTVVAADGFTTSGYSGDTEGYNASTNTWTSLTPDPTARNAACSGGITSQLYSAGGDNGGGGPEHERIVQPDGQ